MNFDLSDEQLMLQDSVARSLADRCSFEQRQEHLAEATGYSASLWSQYAELGLLGLPFAEADGGFGAGPVDTLIVMQALGRVLAPEPYLATVVLAGGVLRDAASTAQRAAHIPSIAAGRLTLALAHSESRSRFDLARVETGARRDGTG